MRALDLLELDDFARLCPWRAWGTIVHRLLYPGS
jgi:hypothetical protein